MVQKNETPPDWAIERARDLTNASCGKDSFNRYSTRAISELDTGLAFARFIANHEEPPVDPVDALFRKICVTCGVQISEDFEFDDSDLKAIDLLREALAKASS